MGDVGWLVRGKATRPREAVLATECFERGVGNAMGPLLADRGACMLCRFGGRMKMLFVAGKRSLGLNEELGERFEEECACGRRCCG